MRPDPTTSNLADIAIWICEINAPSSPLPVHRAQGRHTFLLEVPLPFFDFLRGCDSEAVVLLQASFTLFDVSNDVITRSMTRDAVFVSGMGVSCCQTELEEDERRGSEGEGRHAGVVKEWCEVENVFIKGDGLGDVANVETCLEDVGGW